MDDGFRMRVLCWLLFAAALSASAALLHIAIVFGGARWYQFFGAGQKFVRASETGKIWHHMVTSGIAGVLGLWSAYALSGAGVISRLPFLRAALVTITTIYLLRGLVVLPMLVIARNKVTSFILWSSLTCLGFGMVHLAGVIRAWPSL